MTVSVERQFEGSSLGYSIGGNSSSVTYYVRGLANIDNLSDAFAAGLPNPITGVLMPNGLPCVAVKAHPENWLDGRFITCYGQTNFGYAGYRRCLGSGSAVQDFTAYRNWRKEGAAFPYNWHPTFTTIPRGVGKITKTNYIPNTVNEVEAFLLRNVGKGYVINGTPCFLDNIRGLQSQSSALLVETTFITKAPVRFYPVNSFLGQDVEIPSLDYLEEYMAVPPNANTGAAPTITVMPASALYEEGDAFLWAL